MQVLKTGDWNNAWKRCFINSFEDIIATLNDIDAFLKSNAEQFLGDSFTVNDACITGDGAIMLRCCADWMVDIKTPDSSNSVDDVALL